MKYYLYKSVYNYDCNDNNNNKNNAFNNVIGWIVISIKWMDNFVLIAIVQ